MTLALWRRLVAEILGTGLLVTVVVGSGIMATRLSSDVGLQLLANSITTAMGLSVLILMFGPVSGAHFNPVVSLVDWWLGRREGPGKRRPGIRAGYLAGYVVAQVTGAVLGAILANVMFGLPAVTWSVHQRSGPALWLGEVIATGGLVLLIFALARSGRATAAPAAIGAYIAAAYWFTSSTSFANPAVTVGRAFSDSFAGIEPASVPGFVVAQIVGMLVGVAFLGVLYPHTAAADRNRPEMAAR